MGRGRMLKGLQVRSFSPSASTPSSDRVQDTPIPTYQHASKQPPANNDTPLSYAKPRRLQRRNGWLETLPMDTPPSTRRLKSSIAPIVSHSTRCTALRSPTIFDVQPATVMHGAPSLRPPPLGARTWDCPSASIMTTLTRGCRVDVVGCKPADGVTASQCDHARGDEPPGSEELPLVCLSPGCGCNFRSPAIASYR